MQSRIPSLLVAFCAALLCPGPSRTTPPEPPGAEPDEKEREALAAFDLGDLPRALALMKEAAANRPEDAEVRHRLGVVAIHAGDAKTAVEALEKAVGLDPKHAGARFDLGKLLGQLGRVDAAVVHLRAAARLAPEDPAPRLEEAVVLLSAGRLDEARRVLAAEKPSAAVSSMRAFLELRDGQSAAALEHAAKAAAAEPENVRHRLVLSMALIHAGREAEAVTQLEALVQSAPRTQANVPYALALAAFLSGDPEGARRWMGEAALRAEHAFDPDHAEFDPMAFPTPSDIALLRWYGAAPGQPRAREVRIKKLSASGKAPCHRGVHMAALLGQAVRLNACLRGDKAIHTVEASASRVLANVTASPRGEPAGCIQSTLEGLLVTYPDGAARGAACALRFEVHPAP